MCDLGHPIQLQHGHNMFRVYIMIFWVALSSSQLDLTSVTILSFTLLLLCLRLIDQFRAIIIEMYCQQHKNVDFAFNNLII